MSHNNSTVGVVNKKIFQYLRKRYRTVLLTQDAEVLSIQSFPLKLYKKCKESFKHGGKVGEERLSVFSAI